MKVLDLSTVLMGPYATQMLGDMGADVIKIETLGGDRTRRTGLGRSPTMAGWFMGFNRSKRSLAIDLKSDEGRNVLTRLITGADVLLYNVRPQAMERLGFGYRQVAAINPAILYVGALGFGRGGRYAGLAAFDDLIQAATGMPWLFHYAGAPEPRFCPSPIVDRLMATQVAMNILGGLLARARTGRGQQIDVPMFETMASIMLGDHLGGEAFDPPIGPWGYRRMLAPERRPYRTSDGYIAALPYYEEQWRRFFAAAGRSEWYDDPRFATPAIQLQNINALYTMVAEVMLERSTAEWLDLFRTLDIPAMPVNSIEELMDDPHLSDVGLLTKVEHPTEGQVWQISSPSTWSETQPGATRPAPHPGEHTRAILGEAGYDAAEIDALVASGCVHEWRRPGEDQGGAI
ncbi:CaiB/BaiF CoA transferase family protein [uncultured Sphingomonas sp.]|uniref:CaiB/BaiF CoA transferase family protein n=1 Tax=uncultured Sphingomonas sp. TaxID=158754 RepID=UPI0035CA2FA7